MHTLDKGGQRLRLARQGGIGNHRDIAIKPAGLIRLRQLNGALGRPRHMLVTPINILHRLLRCNPRATGDPARAATETELQPEPFALLGSEADLLIPDVCARHIITNRPLGLNRRQVDHMRALVAHRLHGLEVLSDPVLADTLIDPVPPGARAVLGCRIGKPGIQRLRAGGLDRTGRGNRSGK